MRNLKTYHQLFENIQELTPEQVKWLNKCTDGGWKLNSQTGLVDVDGDFVCSKHDLTDFKGIRFGVVSGDFICEYNQLISLVGSPQDVGGHFSCSNNQLTTLEGAPQKVGGLLNCEDNPVSEETFKSIFFLMEKRKSYLQAVESLWSKIPLEDQALLYRTGFEWVSPEERRKLEAVRAYYGFKGMI